MKNTTRVRSMFSQRIFLSSGVGIAAIGLLIGCGSDGASAGEGGEGAKQAQPLALVGKYDAQTTIAQTPFATIWFGKDGSYNAWRAQCASDCVEVGTFTFRDGRLGMTSREGVKRDLGVVVSTAQGIAGESKTSTISPNISGQHGSVSAQDYDLLTVTACQQQLLGSGIAPSFNADGEAFTRTSARDATYPPAAGDESGACADGDGTEVENPAATEVDDEVAAQAQDKAKKLQAYACTGECFTVSFSGSTRTRITYVSARLKQNYGVGPQPKTICQIAVEKAFNAAPIDATRLNTVCYAPDAPHRVRQNEKGQWVGF